MRSHCFSGLFLCNFLSTKIDYEHPSELGAWGHTTAREGHPARGQECLPSAIRWQLLNVYWRVWLLVVFACKHSLSNIGANSKLKVSKTPCSALLPFGYLLSSFITTFVLAWEMGSSWITWPWFHSRSESSSPASLWQTPQAVSFWLVAPLQMTSPPFQVEYLAFMNAQGRMPKLQL